MMNKVSIKIIVMFQMIFFMIATGFFINYRLNLPRVMVVHSYNPEYSWVQQINQGMKEIFVEQPNIIFNFQYLNIHDNPSTSYMQRAGMLVRRVIDDFKPSVIITVDDDAQDYVGKFYVEDPNKTVIFCATNADSSEYGYDAAKNATGITERTPIDALKTIIPYLLMPEHQPESIKVMILGDFSKTNKFNKQFYDNFNWAPLNLEGTQLVTNFEDWKKAVLLANQNANCLLLLNFSQLEERSGSGKYLSIDSVIKWTEQNATIPVIGCDSEFVTNGGSLAIAPSGYEQGNIAARYALKILNNDDIATLPIVATTQYLIYMRNNALNKFPRLPAFYEQFARGTGKFYAD